jgi:hypothetical protein
MKEQTRDGNSRGSNGKGMFSGVRGAVMGLALAATLAATGLGFSGRAEARVPALDPRADSLSATCGALQDQADSLRAEYKSLGDTNPTSPRMGEILSELRNIWLAWDGFCAPTFGSIGFALPPPPPVAGQATGGTTGTESQPPSDVSGPAVHKVGGVNTLKASH